MSAIRALERMLANGVPLETAIEVAKGFEADLVEARIAIAIELSRDGRAEARRARDAERQAARRALLPEKWNDIRLAVFDRDGSVCAYCFEFTEQPQCDHVVPLTRGGGSDMSNLVTACGPCNASKGDRTPDEWRPPVGVSQ